jgi:hypothetical protein
MSRSARSLGLVLFLAPAGLGAQDSLEGFQGAWRVVEIAAGNRVVRPPEPGLLLFTGRYYSYTLVTSEEPRPAPPAGVASAEALLAAWSPFTANAGTFEVSGSTMTRRPIVAKNPDAMGPGVFNEYSFRLQADTLWMTSSRTESGPARNPTTVKYVRLR